MSQRMQLGRQKSAEVTCATDRPLQYLSKSMERTFKRIGDKEMRRAYLEAELKNAIAHQIKVLRRDRGLSQRDLAQLMGTSQNTISRIEDPSYGKFSVKTLLDLASAFDVALFVRFTSFSDFMCRTWDTSPKLFSVDSFDEDVKTVSFYSEFSRAGGRVVSVKSDAPSSFLTVKVVNTNEYERSSVKLGNFVAEARATVYLGSTKIPVDVSHDCNFEALDHG